MTIREAQEQVDKWINSTGVRYFAPLTNMAILSEEVGELARHLSRQYGEQSYKKEAAPPDGETARAWLADEMADVLWVLLCLANQTGTDLAAALEKNMEKKTKRDAERHRDNEKL
ncbi:MAG TPA: nucleotide pyrophosphohydrolase [Chitinophagaceae bacterium]|nr:nucleotide pyrophosphohydrolase [Chitinophagaceae bacterium]